jgi:16S rRNA (guanine966-N2)-methyltransferase
VRIIGGAWKKSLLHFPALEDLRPTPDRVRETLFNWLGQDLGGARCLDLFAGSGALGFEAASRGAAQVVLVERDRGAVLALRANAERLSATAIDVVGGDASAYVASANERFDVVFLDPPFRQNALPEILPRLALRLEPGARVYAEAALAVDVVAPWQELRRSRAGQVSYQLLQWSQAEDDTSRLPGNV